MGEDLHRRKDKKQRDRRRLPCEHCSVNSQNPAVIYGMDLLQIRTFIYRCLQGNQKSSGLQ